MKKTRDEQINDLVTTLSRVRQEKPEEYSVRLVHYKDMVQGGDGGPWREGADTSLRDLHYVGWRDEDFQTVLELLDEVPVMPEEERKERFAHERTFWNRVKNSIKGGA